MKRERVRHIFALVLLGVFVSLSITVTTHVFSEEHFRHIQNDCIPINGQQSESASACILSQFIALNFDGVLNTPTLGQQIFEVRTDYAERPQIIIDHKSKTISLRAPPLFG